VGNTLTVKKISGANLVAGSKSLWLTATKYRYIKWPWIFYFLRRWVLSYIIAKHFTGLLYGWCLI